MPVAQAGDVVGECTERFHLRGKQAGLGDALDFDGLGETLLRRLPPERGEVGRDRHAGEDLHAGRFIFCDLRRIVGGAVFVAARIEHSEAGFFENRNHMLAQRIAVGVVGEHNADLFVGRHRAVIPFRNIRLGEFGDAEREVIGPLERRRFAGLGAAAEVPGFPRHHGGDARHARRFTGVRHRIDDFRRRGDQHQVDVVGRDHGLGQLTGARRIGLRILIDDLDLVLLAARGEAVGERLARQAEYERVAFAEAAERAAARTDEADFDDVGRLGECSRDAPGKGYSAGAGGGVLDEIAARQSARRNAGR